MPAQIEKSEPLGTANELASRKVSWWHLLLLAAVYFGGSKIGKALSVPGTNVELVYLPVGIMMAATLRWGYRIWPAIVLGGGAYNLIGFLAAYPASVALAMTAGQVIADVVQVFLGIYLYSRFGGAQNPLERAIDCLRFFVFGALVAQAVGATLGVATICLGGKIGWGLFGSLWLKWLISNVTSVLVVTPALLVWPPPARRPRLDQPLLKQGTVYVATVLGLAAGILATSTFSHEYFFLLSFLFVLYATLAWHQRGATASTFIVASVTVVSTAWGVGLSHMGTLVESVLFLEFFLVALALTAMTLSAVLAERLAADAALRQNETRLQTVLQTAIDGFWRLDLLGRFLEVNPAYCRMSGYTELELLGRNITMVEAAGLSPDAAVDIPRIVAQGGSRFETVHRRKDGRQFNLDLSVACQPQGQGLVAFMRDITDRKQAEQELHRLNRFYNLLARVNESIVSSQTREELFQQVCAAAVNQGGFKLAWLGIVNSPTPEVIPIAFGGSAAEYLQGLKFYADDRPEGRGPTGRCLRAGIPCICNDVDRDSNIQPWLEKLRVHGLKSLAALPLRSGGQVVGAWMIYDGQVDCFRQKEMALLEEIAKDISFALDNLGVRQKARQLSLAVEQSSVSIMITDSKGTIEYVNPRFLRVTGYALDEVLGQNPRFLKSGPTTPDQARQYRKLWAAILAGREWNGEFRNKKKNGELYWESTAISPITDLHGRITHFLAVKEDTTKQKFLEDELRQAQKMEAFGRLSAGVAHDFNNLLTAIMGNLEMLQLGRPLEAEQQEAVLEIAKAGERAANLTRQLLLFSRRKAMQPKVLELKAVVESVVKMLRRLIGENITLQERHAAEDTWVLADLGMLEQILMNLSVNSRDAMPRGGRLTIETAAVTIEEATARRQTGQFIRLSVSDTGCGMTPEIMAHIFEPFYTTKEVGKGTGLGLATVFGIVEQHQGWIEVESQVDCGTTFHVYLPHHSVKGDTDFIPRPPAANPSGRETILVVEDEAAVRGLARNILKRHGYQVHEADSASAALEVWRQHQAEIALLFTDMVMPGELNGMELSQRLLKDKPGLKVVYTSGYTVEMVKANSELLQAQNFLQKPYLPEVLLRTIRAALGT